MNRLAMVAGVVLVFGTGATAAAAQQPARTMQQDYDAAIALDAGTDRAAALAAWEALERRAKPASRTRAIAQVRKGNALFRLARYDEALVATRAGLAGLPAADATLAEDRTRALLILGRIAADTLDYAGAAEAFARAERAAAMPGDTLAALIDLAEVQTFVDPVAATATVTRAEALLAATAFDEPTQAMVARRRTALLLNAGDFRAARASATRAVALLGGLTAKTDTSDVSARSDAAIALLLAGDADEARRYMALTGAGRLPKGSFDPAVQMRSPECGGDAGLKPQDVAVIEFSIATDGTTTGVVPIYAAGGGRVALEFARAVQGWSWPAGTVAAIPTFFRYNARVEMRCSTAFQRPSIGQGLDAVLEQWLDAKGAPVPPAPTGAQAAALPGQRAALAAADARSATSLQALAALHRLTTNPVVPREEKALLSARGLAIAVANDAPAQARLALEIDARTAALADPGRRDVFERTVTPLLTMPVYAADPGARAAVRLMLADDVARGKRSPDTARALLLLRRIADDEALAANDPFRVGALIRIASIERQAGQLAAAQAAFAATGLSASQCAIMDAEPTMISMPGSSAFPREAALWGFEGWTQVQYDIAADGRAADQRVLLSYPPFIFSKAGERFFDSARFAKTYRPDGGLGCGGTTTRIRFSMPDPPVR